MKTRRSILLVALSLVLASIPLAGCSKDDKAPTSPGTISFNSGTLAAGSGQYVFTFTTEGHFLYHCHLHPSMQGSIHVVAGGLDSLIVRIENSTAAGFVLQAVGGVTSVKPNGYVHWYNVSGQPHTVTSD